MPEISVPDWKVFLSTHPEAHLLQSAEWGELKSAFGWEAVHLVEGETGAQILFRQLPLGFSFAYLPKGPVTSNAIAPGFWAALDHVCRSRKAVFLKVEPNGWEGEQQTRVLQGKLFVHSPQHIQPRSTLVIDLQGSEEDIFNRMKPKTRYNIRLAGRKDVVVRTSTDISNFHRVLAITGQREKFHVHSQEYYQKAYDLFHPKGLCELFIAEYLQQALSALMVFAYGKTAYYFYGASADVDRNRKPTYPLQWEAIRWAWNKGCTEYDMWGIPDDAANVMEDEAEAREDGLWGVYRFKRGFGGSIKRAYRALDRIYIPMLYKFYQWRFSSSGSD